MLPYYTIKEKRYKIRVIKSIMFGYISSDPSSVLTYEDLLDKGIKYYCHDSWSKPFTFQSSGIMDSSSYTTDEVKFFLREINFNNKFNHYLNSD